MAHRSPLATLGAVVVWFVALLTVNFVVHPAGGQSFAAPPAPASESPGGAASPAQTSPAPTPLSTPRPTRTEGSDDQQFPKKVVYAGRTRTGGLAVAVAVLNGKAAAYVCDGRNVEAWLTGSTDGDEVKLTSRTGVTLEGELDARGRLRGEVEIAGRDYAFRIAEAEKPAGLYRGEGPKTTIGWIVLPDGTQVGVATSGSTSEPAPKLGTDDSTLEIDGETVTVAPVTGDRQY